MRLIGLILIIVGLCAFSWLVVADVLSADPTNRKSILPELASFTFDITQPTPTEEGAAFEPSTATATSEPTAAATEEPPPQPETPEPPAPPETSEPPVAAEPTPVVVIPETGAVLAPTKTISTEVSFTAGWPETMNFEASDVITLSLTIPRNGAVKPQPAVTAPATPTPSIWPRLRQWLFGYPADAPPGTISEIATLHCGVASFPDNYRGFVRANLYGSAFDIAPQLSLRKPIDLEMNSDQKMEWIWSITPKRNGRHKVNITAMAEWGPRGSDQPETQCDVWGRVLGIDVQRPLVAKDELRLGSILTTVIGSVLVAAGGRWVGK